MVFMVTWSAQSPVRRGGFRKGRPPGRPAPHRGLCGPPFRIAKSAAAALESAARLMKLRNQLLALFCMMIFAAAGYLDVQKRVVQKPFGIILFVSDALVARDSTMARNFEGGADHRLALESFPNVALL